MSKDKKRRRQKGRHERRNLTALSARIKKLPKEYRLKNDEVPEGTMHGYPLSRL
jgi:DNA-binding ferritin-like protein (Dps family)